MIYRTLISAKELAIRVGDPDWAFIDCRFTLDYPDQGRQEYLELHIPGAVYAHLDEDLSAKVIPGKTGRHPLPTVEDAVNVFSNFGIGTGIQVVAYDSAGGALAAARLWWMLRWLGHDKIAVLNGGWKIWQQGGYPVSRGREGRPRREFIPSPRPFMIVDSQQIDTMRQNPKYIVIDARAAERYRGENETIDPVAGHIPGAVSAPYLDNLNDNGEFRNSEDLRSIYKALIGDVPLENVAFYCGSGVTSIHDILAAMHAGLGEGRLYVGSWSEWITNPDRPVVK